MDGREDQARNDVLREMIRHEDELRDNRFGYLLTLNGLLFAALGFVWGASFNADGLVVVLACLGVFVGVSGIAAQSISHKAIEVLRGDATGADPRVAGLTHHDLNNWQRAFAPWTSLPFVFVVVWIAIPIIRFTT